MSDLHIPHVNLTGIKKKIEKEAPDVIIFAGDMVDFYKPEYFEMFLRAFRSIDVPKLMVLGNYDLWQEEQSQTRVLYQSLLSFDWTAHGFHLLDKQPYEYDGITFAGNIGWYDYSLFVPFVTRQKVISCPELKNWETMSGNEIRILIRTGPQKPFSDLSEEDFARKIILLRDGANVDSVHWYDRLYVNWKLSDIEVTRQLSEQLRKHLSMAKTGKKVVVLHHAPVLPFIKVKDAISSYLSAFYGSARFWKVIKDFDIKTVIHGHLHRKEHFVKDGVDIFSCDKEPGFLSINSDPNRI